MVFVILFSTLISACGAKPAKPADDGTFKVGLLVMGSVSDKGWNQIAYDAVKRMEKDFGAKTSYVELESSPASFEKAFRDYGSQGYDVVFGHGIEFQDAALAVGKEFPDTFFLISSGSVCEGNVVGINIGLAEPYYLIGLIAASTSKSAVVLGGMEIKPFQDARLGFNNGAWSVNPDYKVSHITIGSFSDPTAAKEATLGALAEGIDFIVPDSGMNAAGSYEAVKEAGKGIALFGIFPDAHDQAPGHVPGLLIADYGQVLYHAAAKVKEGSFKPTGVVEMGLADEGVITMLYFDDETFVDPIPESVRKEVETATQKIIAKEIDPKAAAK